MSADRQTDYRKGGWKEYTQFLPSHQTDRQTDRHTDKAGREGGREGREGREGARQAEGWPDLPAHAALGEGLEGKLLRIV